MHFVISPCLFFISFWGFFLVLSKESGHDSQVVRANGILIVLIHGHQGAHGQHEKTHIAVRQASCISAFHSNLPPGFHGSCKTVETQF